MDMKGKAFNAGQAYVAFTRVKSQHGLFILNFNPDSIKVSSSVVSEMERLVTYNVLPPQPVPNVVALPNTSIIKVGHLNVRSYRAKLEDISNDTCIANTEVMCFTETFLKIQHHPSLEVVSVLVKQQQLCIVAVYRRPQLPLSTFIPLFSDYLGLLPHSAIPTIILGDFNDNQLSLSPTSALSKYMTSLGFSQLVTMPTTDQGSLLDHIYYNQSNAALVDVVDTYYSDHSACFISIPTSTANS